MSRRVLLALSAALGAFVLILAGAAATYTPKTASAPTATDASASGGSVPYEVVRAREAEYRRLLDEANARLRAQDQALAEVASPELAAAPTTVARHDGERDEHEHHRAKHERRHHHEEDHDG